MKNTLVDLNNHLFAELERLSDEDLTGEELEAEISRSKALTGVSSQIIQNGKLLLDAIKFNDDRMSLDTVVPRMLTGDGDGKKTT